MKLGQALVSALLVAAILLIPSVSTRALQVSLNDITQSYTVTITFYTTETVVSLSYVVNSFTQFMTISEGGPPPQVSIVGVQWNPPTLSFFLQNSGGSGYVTVAVSAGGYSGSFDFHVDAYSSSQFNLNFASYSGSAQPAVQVANQRPDSAIRTESSVIYSTDTYTMSFVKTDAIELRQTLTTTISESSQSPVSEPGRPDSTASWGYVAIPAAISGLVGALAWRKRTKEKERESSRRRRKHHEDDDKTRIYE